MRIVVLGAGGAIARRIVREALNRGHPVTGVVRDPSGFQNYDDRLTVVKGDATDAASIAAVSAGANAIVNAISPRTAQDSGPPSSLTGAARALIAGARQAKVPRIVIVGGAGSLEVLPGQQLVDSPDFPVGYKPEALAQRDALEIYRRDGGDLEWTYISPAQDIAAGIRTGTYRTSGNRLLVDDKGHSRISYEDYAVAVIDELERPEHVRRRMSVAY